MVRSDIVAEIFRFINFGAVIAVGSYLFYTKFLGPIKDQIKEKEVFWQNLKQNRKSLVTQQKKLNEEITWQDDYAHELMEKISYWREATERKQAAHIKEKEHYFDEAQARAKKQASYYQQRLVTDKVLPIAFEQAQTALQKEFSDVARQKKYLQSTINQLRERA